MAIINWDDDNPIQVYRMFEKHKKSKQQGFKSHKDQKTEKDYNMDKPMPSLGIQKSKKESDDFDVEANERPKYSKDDVLMDDEDYQEFEEAVVPDSVQNASEKMTYSTESLYKQKLGKEGVMGPPIYKVLLRNLLILIVVLSLTFIFVNYVAQFISVVGDAMNPTLYGKSASFEGSSDLIILEKISHKFKLNRGDVVVFDAKYPITFADGKSGEGYLIRRIIGLENDQIEIVDGKVLRNSVPIEESYTNGEFTANDGGSNTSLTVGVGYVYVLGDNRNVGKSLDSRILGPIKIEDIKGKVIFSLYPFDRIGSIH